LHSHEVVTTLREGGREGGREKVEKRKWQNRRRRDLW
jgi:hypothetical protein